MIECLHISKSVKALVVVLCKSRGQEHAVRVHALMSWPNQRGVRPRDYNIRDHDSASEP